MRPQMKNSDLPHERVQRGGVAPQAGVHRRAMSKDILDFRARVLVAHGQALVTGGDVDR
jgi:hypothetical protein